MSIVRNIAGLAKGMSITFREMLQPTEVENYPDGPGPNRGAHFQDRFRGAHVLQRDENGLEKCVACFLCAAACPANCIYMEAAENTAEKRISSSERYAKGFSSWTQLVAMLFSQLAHADSLREICNGLACCEGKLLHLGIRDTPRRSSRRASRSACISRPARACRPIPR